MLNRKLKIIIITIMFFGFLVVANVGQAAALLANIPCAQSGADGTAPNCELNHLVQIGINVAMFIMGISGSLALLFFIYGGVMFIVSAGSSDKIKAAQQIIVNSVIGLVIIFCSWAIINFTLKSLGYTGVGGWSTGTWTTTTTPAPPK